MSLQQKPFKTFEDLEVYQVARDFRNAMYGVSRRLPDSEKFGLRSQMQRAAVSLTNNIAEGHGRYHYLDQIKFMLQSRGSLEELQDDLNICIDQKYSPDAEISALKQQGWRVYKLLNGYIRYLREQKAGGPLILHDRPESDLADDLDWLIDDSTIQRFNDSTL